MPKQYNPKPDEEDIAHNFLTSAEAYCQERGYEVTSAKLEYHTKGFRAHIKLNLSDDTLHLVANRSFYTLNNRQVYEDWFLREIIDSMDSETLEAILLLNLNNVVYRGSLGLILNKMLAPIKITTKDNT